MLCSVVKHAGSGRARKKCRGKTRVAVECLTTSWVLYHFLSALQQNRAQSRLLYLFYDKEFNNFPKQTLTKLYFPKEFNIANRAAQSNSVYVSVLKLTIDSMLPCVCSVIDHRWRQNVVRTKNWHTRRSRVCHWCSYHILTSSVIYYWIRCTATWNLFVLYNNEKPFLFQNIST